ncbi:unnamed protein product, partial [Ectocarpus fasciculatus]
INRPADVPRNFPNLHRVSLTPKDMSHVQPKLLSNSTSFYTCSIRSTRRTVVHLWWWQGVPFTEKIQKIHPDNFFVWPLPRPSRGACVESTRCIRKCKWHVLRHRLVRDPPGMLCVWLFLH